MRCENHNNDPETIQENSNSIPKTLKTKHKDGLKTRTHYFGGHGRAKAKLDNPKQ